MMKKHYFFDFFVHQKKTKKMFICTNIRRACNINLSWFTFPFVNITYFVYKVLFEILYLYLNLENQRIRPYIYTVLLHSCPLTIKSKCSWSFILHLSSLTNNPVFLTLILHPRSSSLILNVPMVLHSLSLILNLWSIILYLWCLTHDPSFFIYDP